ncbi:MAG: hypothetical protein E6Y34_05025 [Cutibacterium avidum]|nr:hypothetical protein [Cutibacterium avidum]
MTKHTLILHTALDYELPMQIREGLEAYAGDFIDDFDMDAVETDYVAALDAAAATVRPDLDFLWDADEIIADTTADPITGRQATDIDGAIDGIDMEEIFQRHTI